MARVILGNRVAGITGLHRVADEQATGIHTSFGRDAGRRR
jgi:hypothetical protein